MNRRKRIGPPSSHSHRKRRAGSGPVEPIPAGFAERLPLSSADERAALLQALHAPAPTSIRLNPGKPFRIVADPIPWCANGRYLAQRPAFTFDPLLHAGAYYVQEASSMLLEQAVRASGLIDRDVLALDLCAAPGGKSTHLLSLLTPGSLLVANEVHPDRRAVLAENCWKHGAPNVMIAGARSEDLLSLAAEFDLILLDAPCSGEGLFRKDHFARAQWSPDLVQQCAATQTVLVQAAWHALSPGGVLVYSTCTWEAMENEAQAAALIALGAERIEMPVQPAWGVERSTLHGALGYRCYPHRVRGEGFFINVLRKPGSLPDRGKPARTGEPLRMPWLKEELEFTAMDHQGTLHALPSRWQRTAERLRGPLRIVAPGLPCAEPKGAGWRPHPAMALSQALDRSVLKEVPLTDDAALRYLRGEALPDKVAEGDALATIHGIGLGWLHGARTRWNNRWPTAWRIRAHASDAAAVPWSKQ